jgi:uncharacterized protein DUF6152
MKDRLMAGIALISALVLCGPAFSHHGTNASYDLTKQVTVSGTVTEFAWANPHCAVFFDVKDDQGNVAHWVAETNSPGVLARDGWSRKILKPGDQITITLSPSKAGTQAGVLLRLTLPDGKVLSRRNADQ